MRFLPQFKTRFTDFSPFDLNSGVTLVVLMETVACDWSSIFTPVMNPHSMSLQFYFWPTRFKMSWACSAHICTVIILFWSSFIDFLCILLFILFLSLLSTIFMLPDLLTLRTWAGSTANSFVWCSCDTQNQSCFNLKKPTITTTGFLKTASHAN